MARVTVEDCIERVPNRFDLVMIAAQRAREISAGALLSVDRDNDKNPVVALREIAEETVDSETLEQSLIQGLQKRTDFEDFEDEEALDAMESEMEMALNPTPGLSLGEVVGASPEGGADSESPEVALEDVVAPEQDDAPEEDI